MARRRWEAKAEITRELLSTREKRKWQIALRRYVLERNKSSFYAPYFGLDIETIRKWFEFQFTQGIDWTNFGKAWQFEHIVPLGYFDFSLKEDLRMCWNFTNLRVESLQDTRRGNRVDILGAKKYFAGIYEMTRYRPCSDMLDKLSLIESAEMASSEKQRAFIMGHSEYLIRIEDYSSFEFELLNSGRSFEEVQKEVKFLRGI